MTYKAAYTLMAFDINNYLPKHCSLIDDNTKWLVTQQEDSGGFAPWLKHPLGANISCIAIATLGLLSCGKDQYCDKIMRAYKYMKTTQLKSGI